MPSGRSRSQPPDPARAAPEPRHRLRTRLVLGLFLLAFGIIGLRLVQLQLDPDLRLSQEDLHHIGKAEYSIPRGNILDRSGRVLAKDRRVSSLFVDPRRVTDASGLARVLAGRLELDYDQVYSDLLKRDGAGNLRKFVWVKRRLSDAEVDRLGDLKALPSGGALHYQAERVRYYPGGDLAAHVLGFADWDSVGQEGVERKFDHFLRSVPGWRVARKDNRGNFLPSMTLEYEPPSGGNSVQLTIDTALQHRLEQLLDAQLLACEGRYAMGMLMDPSTGAVLAMATRPAFDPNRYFDYEPLERKNRAVVDVFEPGSVFKIVPAAAALEQGLVTVDETIDCANGSYRPPGRRKPIRDVHRMGVEPFWNCFAQSSNIAMVKLALLMGDDRMAEWIMRFGFGKPTGLDLPGESRGIFRPLSQWSRASISALSIGQEISVTVPQLARAFSVIANGGLLVEPYLVEKAVAPDGTAVYRHDAPPPQRILSRLTAEQMKELCHLVVVSEGGTGRRASIAEYRVGGKTGTAQIALPNGGGYGDQYVAVFAGFAPVVNPEICAVIVMAEPVRPKHYGGYACAPVFREIVREALIRRHVPEDPVPQKVLVKKTTAEDADTVVARLSFLEPDDELEDGPFRVQLKDYDGALFQGERWLPDFKNMTKHQAWKSLQKLDLKWDFTGTGRVVMQSPPAGTPLDEVQLCQLIFSSEAEGHRQPSHDASGT
jgi:cell division protein FtsI (penicillin-binding protein 3)